MENTRKRCVSRVLNVDPLKRLSAASRKILEIFLKRCWPQHRPHELQSGDYTSKLPRFKSFLTHIPKHMFDPKRRMAQFILKDQKKSDKFCQLLAHQWLDPSPSLMAFPAVFRSVSRPVCSMASPDVWVVGIVGSLMILGVPWPWGYPKIVGL